MKPTEKDLVHEQFLYYLAHQEEFVKKFNGKVIVLHGHQVVGVHNTYEEAHFASVNKYPAGTYILQSCSPGPDGYTMKTHARYIVR